MYVHGSKVLLNTVGGVAVKETLASAVPSAKSELVERPGKNNKTEVG